MKRRGSHRHILLVLAGILLTLGAGRLSAQPVAGARTVVPADLFVDDDHGGAQDGSALRPFRTVQQAIDAAKGNAVIAVAGGIYPENIRVQDKAVRLYGGYVGGTSASYAAGTEGNFKACDPAANPSHACVELVPGNEVHELREDHLSGVHESSSTARVLPKAVDSDNQS